MYKINVYYWNNGVGIVNDAILLKSILKEYDVMSYDMSVNIKTRIGDLGIFIQNIWSGCVHIFVKPRPANALDIAAETVPVVVTE